MKVLDIIPREICVNMEFTSEEVIGIHDFIEKALPLYAKVYLDGPINESASVVSEFKSQLQSIFKVIEQENKE